MQKMEEQHLKWILVRVGLGRLTALRGPLGSLVDTSGVHGGIKGRHGPEVANKAGTILAE